MYHTSRNSKTAILASACVLKGMSTLHVASRSSKGRKDIADLLLAKGAIVNAKDKAGRTPLYAAVKYGSKDIAGLLLTKGADVNSRGEYGYTPLHNARTKHVAELLLERGADIHAKTDSGFTPLHTAADEGRKKIVVLLLARGADVNARNKPATLKSDQLHVENSSPT